MACLILAGGDASRLGIPLPKGMFDPKIDGISSIFELIVRKLERLNKICEEAHPECPDIGRDRVVLVIMTNQESYNTIVDYFREHKNFGYKSIIFFP